MNRSGIRTAEIFTASAQAVAEDYSRQLSAEFMVDNGTLKYTIPTQLLGNFDFISFLLTSYEVRSRSPGQISCSLSISVGDHGMCLSFLITGTGTVRWRAEGAGLCSQSELSP